MSAVTHQSKEGAKLLTHLIKLCFFLLPIVAIGFAPATGWADKDEKKNRHDPKRQIERMAKRFNLTEDQQAKILPILQEKQDRMQELHRQMKEVRQDAMANIEAQLTPEQREEFQKAKEKRWKKGKGRKDNHGKRNKKGRGKGPKMTYDNDEEDFQDPDTQ